MAYFPMYVEIKDNDCLIVGGGRVALRKVEVLLDFQAKVHVIAEEMCDEINELFEKNRIVVTKKKFEPEDIDKCILVVAATDNHQLNHKISEIAKRKGREITRPCT